MDGFIKKSVVVPSLACLLGLLINGTVEAKAPADQRLVRCLTRAEEMPDQAAAETTAWLKKGGGDPARVCHAFAQFHRGEFAAAAEEFALLAAKRDKNAPKQAASLHVQAALAAMRVNDHKRAESEFAAAIKLEPHDPDVWVDRATERAATEHYWEALADVNKALELMPDMPEALRLRGQIHLKLGQDNSAKSDFEHAGTVEDTEKGVSARP